MKHITVEDAKGIIVIVHGAFEHSGRYNDLANRWVSEGYEVVYGDLPAHGNHEGIKGHIDHFEEYLEEIASWINEAMKSNLPIFLLAHSMGGLAAIRLLEENELPLKAVVLSSPGLGIKNPPPKPLQVVAKGLNVVVPKLQLNGNLNPEHVTRNVDVLKRDQGDRLMLKKVSVRWYKEFEKGIERAFNKIDTYQDVPTLVMQAGDDKIVNKEATLKWFNSLHIHEKFYKEWEGLYHEIFNDPEKEDVFHYAKSFVEMHL
ncbi:MULTISPECIES: alpha/beta hydrolase [Pontibacillus]|uniref:Alpha/beta hydrolase n=1 Tax=Pontibacillus chungwhensis TaxID=265426 RepID=A0ABY8UY18_9BACI|nr:MULTISPECIES: alpha/beta hydrolase [Pontibacillus]MCD5325044.1 alpha/beta hydrolase [Pontibacillus sp. HN14]WIF97300.1 alpha/beta hydrolase [Pontibacillus chungwhensis]